MSTLPEAFYRASGDAYEPSAACRGPWHRDYQHAGPPAALIGREIERFLAQQRPGFQIARFALEIVRPVPLSTLGIRCQLIRSGRQVSTVEAELQSLSGDTVCRARALCIRQQALALPDSPAPQVSAPRAPEKSDAVEFNFFEADMGYHRAMELRAARGALGDGDVCFWLRMRIPLLHGEQASPLQRALIAADSGNGVSQRYPAREIGFSNPDLDLCLFRAPLGDWIALEAITWPGDTGMGIADTRLWDSSGAFGRATQTLLFTRQAVPS